MPVYTHFLRQGYKGQEASSRQLGAHRVGVSEEASNPPNTERGLRNSECKGRGNLLHMDRFLDEKS